MDKIWEAIIDSANECEAGTPSSSTVPTIGEYIRWVNTGLDLITNKVNGIEKLITFSGVVYKDFYTLPAEFIRPINVEYSQSSFTTTKLVGTDINKFKNLYMTISEPPVLYSVWDKKLYINPILSSSAQTTTLTGAHTTETTITCASTSGFPTRGRIIIDSEVIEYTYISDTEFLYCTRGAEGTTIANHANAATITERNIRVYSSVRYLARPMNIYTVGTATFTNASATVAAGTTAPYFSGNVFVGWYIGQGTNPSKWYKITAVGANLTIDSVYAEATSSNSTYVITPEIEIPKENAFLLPLYLNYKTKLRMEEFSDAAMYKKLFEDSLIQVKADMIDKLDAYPETDDLDSYYDLDY